jgi:hypothetical protein
MVLVGVVQSVVKGRDQANRVVFRILDDGEMVPIGGKRRSPAAAVFIWNVSVSGS